MKLSVVVVTFNSAACIEGCIESVRRLLPTAEIVVVDNASTDTTADVVASSGPDVRLVRSETNVGFGRGSNRGVEAASGTHVLFLNPDVRLAAVDAAELERLAGLSPFGLVAPLLASGTGSRRRTEHGHAEPHWLSDYLQNTLHALRPRELPAPRRARSRRGTPAWVSGAMLLVERSEFLAVGGFDSRFFLYYEDRDLAARYRTAQLPIRTTRALVGEHEIGGSSGDDSLRVEPMAWALLSWLQYLYVWRGPALARRAAVLSLSTLRGMRFALDVVRGATPDRGRVARKADQLDAVLAAVDAKAAGGHDAQADGFCPDARRIVRGWRQIAPREEAASR